MLITIIKLLYGFPLDDDFIIEDDEVISKIKLSYDDKHHIIFMTIALLYFMLMAIYFISIKSLKC
jgi:hypothetical protein